jgi:hypothetical protein
MKRGIFEQAKGAFLSTKGAFLSLTKDRKGAFLSTKSATLRIRVRVTARVRGRVTKGGLTRSQSSPSLTGFIPKPYLFFLDNI